MTRITLTDDDGTRRDGVWLPLDAAQIDDAAVEVMAKAIRVSHGHTKDWNNMLTGDRECWMNDARAALIALLAHLAEVDRG